MGCTFIALFADAATAGRAKDALSDVPGIDRVYEPREISDLLDELAVSPAEGRELREGARRGERPIVIEIWEADSTVCGVLDAMAGANLLIRTRRRDDAADDRYRPYLALEGIRSDFYIG
jgi:hypothetical protein